MPQNATIKSGYKLTDVGILPNDWDVKELRNIGQCFIGLTYKPTDVKSDGVLVLRASNVQDDTLDFNDNVFVDVAVPERALVHEGDILICVRNGSRDLIGKCALIDDRAKGMAFGAFMAVFRTLDHHFVFQQFRSETIKRQIQENLGATINQITNRNLESFRIPWPRERLERKTIAAALTDVDELIDALDNLTAKKRDLKQAVMQQLLTGRTRLPGFSEEWEVKRLGDVLARMANGAVYKPTTSFGLPITRIETISDGVIDFSRVGYTAMDPELNKYRIEPGDILFSHINSLDHIGKAAFFEDERQLYHGMNLLLLRTNEKNNSRFVYFWLTSEMGRKQTRILAKQAVNQASINTAELKKVEILFPPVPEQVAIATVLSDLDAEILAIEQRRDKIRSLKLGMTQELLTGKTRLI